MKKHKVCLTIRDGEARCEGCPLAAGGTWIAESFQETIQHCNEHHDAEDVLHPRSVVDMLVIFEEHGGNDRISKSILFTVRHEPNGK